MVNHLRRPPVQMALLGIAIAVLFGRTLFFPFLHWDDFAHIVRNDLVTSGEWAAFWLKSQLNLYIPFSYSAWTLLCSLKSPCDPQLFHLMNLGLHFANTLLVLSLARHYLKDEIRPFLVAIIFAVHPIQVDTVAWISGGRDLWAAFFALLAWRVWLKDNTYGVLPALIFSLSLLSKPAYVALPVVFLLLDKFAWRRTWLLFVPSVAFGLATWLGHGLTAMKTITPAVLRPWMALDAVGFYVWKLIWPWPLLPDYGRTAGDWVASTPLVFGFLGLAFMGLAVYVLRKNPWPMTGVILILPVLGFIPYRFQDVSIVSDHYLYLSVAAFALGLVVALRQWIYLSPVLAAWAALSFWQVGAWQNTETLGAHVLEHNPRSFSFHNAIADAAAAKGDYPLALTHFGKSLQINPTMIETQLGIPPVLYLSGQKAAAIEAYLAIEKVNGLPPEAERNLITMLNAEGRTAEAQARALRLTNPAPSEKSSTSKDP